MKGKCVKCNAKTMVRNSTRTAWSQKPNYMQVDIVLSNNQIIRIPVCTKCAYNLDKNTVMQIFDKQGIISIKGLAFIKKISGKFPVIGINVREDLGSLFNRSRKRSKP